MNHDLESKVVRFGISVLLALLVVISYVFYQSYQGRVDLVDAQRAACERGKKDRNANAEGWRIAEAARKADGQFTVANKYRRIASGLEARGRINCSEVFPKAGFFP